MAPTIEKLNVPVLVLGEGPHWDIKTQSLYFVDIVQCDAYKYVPATKDLKKIHIDGIEFLSFIIPVKGKPDHFVIGAGCNVDLVHLDFNNNKVLKSETLVTVNEPKNRLNDGKCDSSGRLWMGTMDKEDNFDLTNSSFFSFSKQNGLKKHFSGVSISNGIAYTEANDKLYYIDSMTYKIREYDFDIAKGTIKFSKDTFDLKKFNVEGLPDGMTIDSNGNLWTACARGSAIIQVDPKTNKLLQTIKFDKADLITSVAFGGPQLDELYVTTASIQVEGRDAKNYPESGSMYRVTGINAKGVPMFEFDLNA